MEQAAPRRFRLRLTHIAWAVLIYCGLVAAVWPRRTYDIWWHLATGKLIVEHHAVPTADPFSYTRAGKPWIAHEWGWEVPMYLLYSAWGHAGLMILRTSVAVIACALLAWLCLRRGASPLATMAIGAVAIFAARPLFNDRPQVVSIAFFAAMLCLIELSERGRPRALLAAPLLMIPWVNLHGGFIFGPGLLALYAAVCVVRWVRQHRARAALTPAPGIVFGAIILAIAATLVNPRGIAGMAYPVHYVFGDYAWHKTWISEYKSPDFSEPIFLYLGMMIVLTPVILAASRRRARLWDIALVAVFLFLTLKWQRNVALFAFAVAPMLAVHLSGVLDDLGLRSFDEPRNESEPTALYVGILLVLVVSAGFAVPSALRRVDAVFRADCPVECVNYIEQHHLPGRMFNTYHWGGYLIWHLWPEQRVFVDGRADVMGHDLVMDWERAYKLQEGWQEVLARYRIDWVLISPTSALCRALDIEPSWRLACQEPTARLYVRVGSVADAAASPDD